jgi:hypothetical protein
MKNKIQKPKNSIPIFKATNKEYIMAAITPSHSKNLLFIYSYYKQFFITMLSYKLWEKNG